VKLTLTRSAIHDTLSRIARVIPSRTTIPMLGHILVRAERGVLSLAATNLDMDARATVASDVAEDGVYAVPGERLAAIVAALGTDARISMESSDAGITLKSGRSKFNLTTLPAEDFSNWAIDGEWPTKLKIDAKELLRLFATAAPFAGTDPNHFHLMTVNFEGDGTDFNATSASGPKLGNVSMKGPDKFACLLPIAAVGEIKSLLDKLGGEVAISISSQKAAFTFASGFVFTCRMIDATFPDWRRILSKVAGNDHSMFVGGADFGAMISRLIAMAGDDLCPVKLTIADGVLRAAVRHLSHGDAEDEVPCEYEGDPITIGFPIKQLQELTSILNADTIQIKFADAVTPTLWQALGDNDDGDRRFVLSPRLMEG
jgi:DNA polymerase III subunit beta